MIYLPLVFFGAAAAGGLTLVVMKNKGKELPKALAYGHGVLAATGLVCLIYNVAIYTSDTLMNVSLVLFLGVALGGFTLFSFYLRKKALPDILIGIHGLGAVASFIVLILAIFR